MRTLAFVLTLFAAGEALACSCIRMSEAAESAATHDVEAGKAYPPTVVIRPQ